MALACESESCPVDGDFFRIVSECENIGRKPPSRRLHCSSATTLLYSLIIGLCIVTSTESRKFYEEKGGINTYIHKASVQHIEDGSFV